MEELIGDFIVSDQQLFLFREIGDKEQQIALKPKNGGEEKAYTVRIRFVKLIQDRFGLFCCLNLLIKKLMRAKRLEQIGRAYFDPSKPIRISGSKGSFDLWPGFKVSLERIAKGLYLNAEVKHKVILDETVLDAMRRRNLSDAELCGRGVITWYNGKHYIITSVDRDHTMHTKFFSHGRTDKKLSVYEYMKDAQPRAMAKIHERDHKQPLLVCSFTRGSTGKGREIYLIPSLCSLTGLTEAMRNDADMMKRFKESTLVPPQKRLDTLDKDLIADFGDQKFKEQAKIGNWNIIISRSPLRLRARVLAKEPLFMKNSQGKDTQLNNTCGAWVPHTQHLHFHTVVEDVKGNNQTRDVNWAIIFPDSKYINIEGLIETLIKVAAGAGMFLTKPRAFPLKDGSVQDYREAMTRLINSLSGPDDVHFTVCMLPTKRQDTYEAIKSVYCSERPMVTQCVTANTLKKGLMSVCTKLIVQILGKIGGAPWVFDSPLKRRAMIVGIDISRNSGKSTVGMVASINKNISKFYSRVYEREEGSPEIKQIADFIKDACTIFATLNPTKVGHGWPSTIIVYREGAGESQMQAVIKEECELIKKKVSEVGCKEIVYVVVHKRIDTRFFLEQEGQRVANVESGTLVDTDVVASAERHREIGTDYDFFLVGQSHMQGNSPAAGTMNPAHYWVKHHLIEKEYKTATTPDELQRLTYKLCHLYYNWMGTVSAPALCKYAKVLATLAGKHLERKEVSEFLHTKLYYL
eukprot:Phypoly_transcript_02792.p1 GENE.Phypoly_transcript_02792~~Phypoly_transcript_02792.p1  ORF type:complete len:854 (+),score=108.70 Phypoly_transcript_02792:322-2562(+)